MVKVISGVRPDGTSNLHYIDEYLKRNLDRVKEWVTKKEYDYVGIVSGLPGVGKSNFAQGVARYCDHNFTEQNIAFTDDQFIEISNNVPEFSSVILDESFANLNSKVGSSTQFLRILNHLQLIRQKHLFIFLCLPNYFDLQKGIAIYRSSHLFLIYSDTDTGDRGRFAVFDRDSKRQLYIRGLKFMDYNCVDANFIGRFTKQTGIDDKAYDSMKREHLLNQEKVIVKGSVLKIQRDNFVVHLFKDKWTATKIGEVGGFSRKTVYNILNEHNVR